MPKIQIKCLHCHGMSNTSFFIRWWVMIQRCNNHNNQKYSNYGKRGIKVCKNWLKFENFRDDMYQSYLNHCKKFGKRNTSLGRINNNGNYEPGNCRWATWKEQFVLLLD